MWGPCELFIRWILAHKEVMAPENMGNKDDSMQKLLKRLTVLVHSVRDTFSSGPQAGHLDPLKTEGNLEEDIIAAGFVSTARHG